MLFWEGWKQAGNAARCLMHHPATLALCFPPCFGKQRLNGQNQSLSKGKFIEQLKMISNRRMGEHVQTLLLLQLSSQDHAGDAPQRGRSSGTRSQLSTKTSPKEITNMQNTRQSHVQTSTLSTSKIQAEIHRAGTTLVCKALPNPTVLQQGTPGLRERREAES